MFGILNVNKPTGWTSRDVVNRVQRLVRPAKAGHAGTLDPLATGVLVVCVGPATRLISYVQQMPKTYEATFLLGQSSASDDVESEVERMEDAPIPTREQVEAALPQFVGSIKQRPPAFSALKVNGQRAYKLARQGDSVTLDARPVEIYELRVDRYEYPELQLTMRCGSGTYVRSVGRDLAASLGTAAVMSALQRTAIGSFAVEQALSVDELDENRVAESLLPPLLAVEHLTRRTLTQAEAKEISHGRLIAAGAGELADEVIAGVDADGKLLALLREKRPGRLGPVCNFSQST